MGPEGDGGAGDARAADEARQAQIRAGTANINSIFDGTTNPDGTKTGGFDDTFFSNREKAYSDYANPQLEDQYGKAKQALTFALARSGNLDSSARAAKEADLQKLYDTNKRSVADEALSYSTGARNNVESARSDLIRTLQSTGDAQGAATAAQSRAQALTQPDAYQPLGQLFSNFTSALGTQGQLEQANNASNGAVQPTYYTGLFGSKNRAVVSS